MKKLLLKAVNYLKYPSTYKGLTALAGVAVNYLKYPSTYKGLTALAGVAGVAIVPEQQDAIAAFGLGVYGLISVFFSDADVNKTPTK